MPAGLAKEVVELMAKLVGDADDMNVPGFMARFANGVRSLAGARAHPFAKGSAFQSRLAIEIFL